MQNMISLIQKKDLWLNASIFGVGSAYVLCHSFIPGFTENFPVLCFSKRFFDILCPFCGVTRGCACLVKMDFRKAIACNPLIVFGVLFVSNKLLEHIFKIFKPGKNTGSSLLGECFFYSFILAVLFIGAVRCSTFLCPDINPYGFLIPPD